jgi:hypothetical protein
MQKKVMKLVYCVKYLSVGMKGDLVQSEVNEWGLKC